MQISGFRVESSGVRGLRGLPSSSAQGIHLLTTTKFGQVSEATRVGLVLRRSGN